MDVEHDAPDLEKLEKGDQCKCRFAAPIVHQFRRVMLLIRSVPNETELYKYPSRRFEKLKGNRSHQHSLRLNDQWRLIVEIRKGAERNRMGIIEIEDYHR